MKRFAFRLERVLEVRTNEERIAEGKLAARAAVCTRLQMALEANARATVAANHERFRKGGTASDFLAGEHFMVRLSAEKEKLLRDLALAEAEREQARLSYVEASKKRELVTKLREREEAAYYRAVNLEEVKTLDDLASGAQVRRQAGY